MHQRACVSVFVSMYVRMCVYGCVRLCVCVFVSVHAKLRRADALLACVKTRADGR